MRVAVDFESVAGVPFDGAGAIYVIEETLKTSRIADHLDGKRLSFAVSFVTAQAIQSINHTYRDKDAVTDVISIGPYSDEHDLATEGASDVFVGEIYLNWDYLRESARLHEVTTHYECVYILSHGVLHLIGYEHSPEMFALQERVAERFLELSI